MNRVTILLFTSTTGGTGKNSHFIWENCQPIWKSNFSQLITVRDTGQHLLVSFPEDNEEFRNYNSRRISANCQHKNRNFSVFPSLVKMLANNFQFSWPAPRLIRIRYNAGISHNVMANRFSSILTEEFRVLCTQNHISSIIQVWYVLFFSPILLFLNEKKKGTVSLVALGWRFDLNS